MKGKILFLVQLPPPIHGASLMNKMIKESRLVNEEFACTFFDISPESEQKKLGTFTIKKLMQVTASYFKLLFLLASSRFHLCYFALSPVGFAFYKDVFYIALLKLFRIHVVFHMHGKGIRKNDSGFKRALYRFVFKNNDVIHLADCLFVDISSYRTFIRKEYTLANGIQVVDKAQLSDRKDSLITITYLSNLIPAKGAHVLLEAVAFLSKEYSSRVRFIIAGGGRDEQYNIRLENLVESNSSFDIKLSGPVYGDDKNLLLSRSDIFVLPTTYKNECFPLSILEAMQFGLAICSTKEGAIAEIVTPENGFIFDAAQPKQLADAIKILIDDQALLASCQQVSKQLFAEKYTFDVFERKLIEILKNSMER